MAQFDARTPHPGKSVTELPEYTLFTILGPMVLFNVCYTGSWICETMVARWLNSAQHRRFREYALKSGLGLSLAFPALLVFLWFYQWKTGRRF
jgi:hypothetical protein